MRSGKEESRALPSIVLLIQVALGDCVDFPADFVHDDVTSNCFIFVAFFAAIISFNSYAVVYDLKSMLVLVETSRELIGMH